MGQRRQRELDLPASVRLLCTGFFTLPPPTLRTRGCLCRSLGHLLSKLSPSSKGLRQLTRRQYSSVEIIPGPSVKQESGHYPESQELFKLASPELSPPRHSILKPSEGKVSPCSHTQRLSYVALCSRPHLLCLFMSTRVFLFPSLPCISSCGHI